MQSIFLCEKVIIAVFDRLVITEQKHKKTNEKSTLFDVNKIENVLYYIHCGTKIYFITLNVCTVFILFQFKTHFSLFRSFRVWPVISSSSYFFLLISLI